MSKALWTDNQRDAIYRRGGQLLVSAAAGSGKTSVLVQRIIELLTDPVNPVDADRLLVVTFTNAAAAEMAAKIKQALEARIADDPQNTALRRQMLLLGRAQISTVHAFCMTLLRDHFSRLDIPVDFAIADEVLSASLRRRALERTMDMLYADAGSDITALSDLFGRARSDNDTAGLIEKLYEFETNLAFPRQWEARVLEDIEQKKPLTETAVGGYLFEHAEGLLETARAMLSDALELCAEDEKLKVAYSDAISDDFNFANRLLAQVAARDWDACAAAAAAYSPTKMGPYRGENTGLKSAAQELRNAAKKIFTDKLSGGCFICSERQYQDDLVRLAVPQRALFGAVRLYGENLAELKLERRVFDFSDLERYAVRLLCGEEGAPTDVARAESARFDHILVDEYQDTNEIQDLIFQSVSRGGKNLFFVGDVKQSIYSFRRADPEIFILLRDRCYAHETGLFPARIPLAHNFRSSTAVIEAVNAVFSPVMTRALGGTDYKEPGEPLEPGFKETPADKTGMEIALVKMETEASEPDYVAHTVAAMLRDGYEIRDRGTLRPCRESDFCVLLRSPKDRLKEYVRAFERVGVRCAGAGDDNAFQSSEMAVMLSLLRVIDNPRRDVDLAAVMLSPLFGFTPDDLAALRLRDGKAPLYALLSASEDPKTAAFMDTLASLRKLRNTLPVGQLVQQVADRLQADIALCAGDDFRRRRGNLRLLIEYAESFASTGGSLAAFLRVCDAAAQSGRAVRQEFSAPPGAVCITTVHKSKGLEWPIVIVANTDKPFNLSDSRDSVMLFDAALGCGARVRTETAGGVSAYAHRTLNYAALALRARQKTDSEEMRVLYVALTRARQKLIVTAALADPEKTLASWQARSMRAVEKAAALASRWIDWIGLALLCRRPAFAEIGTGQERTIGAIRMSVPLPVAEDGVAAPEKPAALPDSAVVAGIDRRVSFVYGNAALSDVPSKLAVTDLAKEKGLHRPYTPAFARDGVSATDRGNAIHLFMQCADYAAAARSVEDELERLVKGAYIDADLAKGIDTGKLRTFFDSALGRRVAGDDVLREYAFIDAIDAGTVADLPPGLAERKIMVQGIADCIALDSDGAILIDYKSDRVTEAAELVRRYAGQLALYRAALNKRLPSGVKQCFLYSFELGQAVEV